MQYMKLGQGRHFICPPRVGNTGWENSTKLQNLVFLLVKILGFAHPIFTRLHHPSRKLFYAVKWGNFTNVM